VIAILAGASVTVLVMGLAGIVIPPRGRLASRVRPYTIAPRVATGRSADLMELDATPTSSIIRLIGPPVVALFDRMARLLDRTGDEALALRLRQAGFELSPEEYRLRVAGSAALFVAGGALIGGVVMGSSIMTVVLAACGLAFGLSRWRGRVDRAIVERRERIRLELYTVNQLLAVHVRSGAGPVQAVQRVVDRCSATVVRELEEALRWMAHGVAEADAFRRVAQLTPEPSAARTYKLFASSAERGSDLGAALRALSEDLRDARREELRRLATKRRAAMLLPIIGVLAPVMLLFIAAPIPSMLFGNR
jgi:tight adherence protein C